MTALAGCMVPALLAGGPADALIRQGVGVGFQDPPNPDITVGDQVIGPPLRTVAGEISGPGYHAQASVGTFGDVGMAGELFRTGTLGTAVSVFSSEYVNPFSVPQHAETKFIIDGGRLALLAGEGSLLTFQFTLDTSTQTTSGLVEQHLTSRITLEERAGGLAFATSGPSLGATFDGHFEAIIPLSFRTVDLGLIAPNGVITLDYGVLILAETTGFTEIARWNFSDPFSVDGSGEVPIVRFDAAPAAVPEPSSLALPAAGLGLAISGRRRSRCPCRRPR